MSHLKLVVNNGKLVDGVVLPELLDKPDPIPDVPEEVFIITIGTVGGHVLVVGATQNRYEELLSTLRFGDEIEQTTESGVLHIPCYQISYIRKERMPVVDTSEENTP